MRRTAWLVCFGLLVATAEAAAQQAVFVVRHGEKISDEDERLTEAGRARAARLSEMLKRSGITAVYSTDTERTLGTARPLADALGLKVAIYDTGKTADGRVDAAPFAERLRREAPKEIVLVVGHSNTVGPILAALGCAEEVTIAGDEYDNLFVVVPREGGKPAMVRMRY
jgi:broad specificity phosphatase PhoE